MARIEPLTQPYEPMVEAALMKWMPPGADAADALGLFRTMYVRQDLADRARPLGAGLLGRGTLPPQDRELVIDRTCARCGAEYEWGVHVAAFGAAVGLSEEQLAATYDAEPVASLFSTHQQALLTAVDELHARSRVSDATWRSLASTYDDGQLLELVMLVGWYLIAFVANSAEVELEPWGARFPA